MKLSTPVVLMGLGIIGAILGLFGYFPLTLFGAILTIVGIVWQFAESQSETKNKEWTHIYIRERDWLADFEGGQFFNPKVIISPETHGKKGILVIEIEPVSATPYEFSSKQTEGNEIIIKHKRDHIGDPRIPLKIRVRGV